MSKIVPTKGNKRQSQFDTIISDLKDDELDFMSQKYNKDLLYHRKDKNFNQKDYLEMQQRKKMIDEEKRNRRIFRTSISSESEERFYAEEGIILDSENNTIESIAYNYNETEIISLPSGNKGKKKIEKWEPEEIEDESQEFTMMSEDELSWEDWCKKKCLIK